MRSKCKWYFLLLAGVVILLASPIIACRQPTPVPTAPPTPVPVAPPTPVDKPSYSADEVCVYIWSFLPDDLPNGYEKSQLLPGTRSAIYQGNGKWGFEVLGAGEITVPLPTTINKEPYTESWFEEHKEKVTTYELRLTADFYEKTSAVEILDIEKFNIKTDIKVSKIPIYPELLVNWIGATEVSCEGSVTNAGKIPLHDIQVEFLYYDSDDNLVTTKTASLEPSIIAVGEDAHFKFSSSSLRKLQSIRYYRCRFISPSGKEIFSRWAPD